MGDFRVHLLGAHPGRTLVVLLAFVAVCCGGHSPTAPTTSASSGQGVDSLGSFSLSALTFTAPNTVFHSASDRVTYMAGYSGNSSGGTVYFYTSIVFVRDDGATWLATCGGGSVGPRGGDGGGGYRDAMLGPLYSFGHGHSLDAVILGVPLTTNPIAAGGGCPLGTFSAAGGAVNWSAATNRLDVPLHWTMQ